MSRTAAFGVAVITIVTSIAFLLTNSSVAQQVSAIDLTRDTPRLNLRHPSPTEGTPSGPRGGSHQTILCRNDHTDGSLKVTLLSLDKATYQAGDRPTFEVQVENVGTTPILLPSSPNLSDLQPSDAGQKFSYSSLKVALWLGGSKWSSNMGGGFALYGNESHAGTLLTLNPGECVRLIGKGIITIALPSEFSRLAGTGDVVSNASARVSIYKDETLLTPTGEASVSTGMCLTVIKGATVPVQLTTP